MEEEEEEKVFLKEEMKKYIFYSKKVLFRKYQKYIYIYINKEISKKIENAKN